MAQIEARHDRAIQEHLQAEWDRVYAESKLEIDQRMSGSLDFETAIMNSLARRERRVVLMRLAKRCNVSLDIRYDAPQSNNSKKVVEYYREHGFDDVYGDNDLY
jgi:hypothetical protein